MLSKVSDFVGDCYSETNECHSQGKVEEFGIHYLVLLFSQRIVCLKSTEKWSFLISEPQQLQILRVMQILAFHVVPP
jgi:hypothetical protein